MLQKVGEQIQVSVADCSIGFAAPELPSESVLPISWPHSVWLCSGSPRA